MSFYDIARMYTSTTGDSDITLGAAVPGCKTFADAGVSDSEDVEYGLITYSATTRQPVGGETGLGRYISSGTVFKRNTVYNSTDSDNSAIDLTGITQVYLMPTAIYYNDMLPTTITLHEPSTTPSAATLGDLKLYKSQHITGLEEIFIRGSNMPAVPLQRALAYKPGWYMFVSNVGFSSGPAWGGASNTGTASTQDTSTFGAMCNFVTGASAGQAAGIRQGFALFSRGNNHYRGGFFGHARVGFIDKTGTYLYVGFGPASTIVVTSSSPGDADDPGGDYAMFQYSPTRGGSGDTNFQFITKDNSTQHVTDTTMAATADKVYEFTIYCPMASSTIYWRIYNVTDNTEVSNSETNNLPTATTNMANFAAVVNHSGGGAKNIRVAYFWAEPDNVDTP